MKHSSTGVLVWISIGVEHLLKTGFKNSKEKHSVIMKNYFPLENLVFSDKCEFFLRFGLGETCGQV